MAPNSNMSKPPPTTSQDDSREDLKYSLPLDPDIVHFDAEKGDWIQEGSKGLTTSADKRCFGLQFQSDFNFGV